MSTYPGGKAGAGVYQRIICEMPPHHTYVEAFAGGAAILRYKRPAAASIAIDADAAAAATLRQLPIPGLSVVHGDALSWLHAHPEVTQDRQTLLYLDPPYLMHTRSRQRPLYACEFATEEEHEALLQLATSFPAMVAISGYRSDLYAARLRGWRLVTFPAMTRGGTLAEECLWMNYPEPAELHDYRYLGEGFRERERIKRKIGRWTRRLEGMDRQERYAMLAALEELRPPSS